MQVRRTLTAALLGASLVAAAPSAAGAEGGHHGGPQGGARGGAQSQSFDRRSVPSRVSSRLKRADRALDRASDAVDDGNATTAASALKAVNSNLAAATKAAKKRASSDNGPDAFFAVAAEDDHVIGTVVSLYDGADDATVAALTQTLGGAIDGRDGLIAAIAALPAADQSNYGFVLDSIDNDVTDEIASIDDALSDDTLTDQAKADLTAARAKLVATQSTVQGLGASLTTSASDTSGSTSQADADCPRDGRRGGSDGTNGTDGTTGSSSQEAPQA